MFYQKWPDSPKGSSHRSAGTEMLQIGQSGDVKFFRKLTVRVAVSNILVAKMFTTDQPRKS
jgi:hypothetical protein